MVVYAAQLELSAGVDFAAAANTLEKKVQAAAGILLTPLLLCGTDNEIMA